MWPSTCRLDDVSLSLSSVTNMLFTGSKRTGYFLNKNVNFGCLSWNFSSAFTPNATGQQDPMQSERIDAYRANFFDLAFGVHEDLWRDKFAWVEIFQLWHEFRVMTANQRSTALPLSDMCNVTANQHSTVKLSAVQSGVNCSMEEKVIVAVAVWASRGLFTGVAMGSGLVCSNSLSGRPIE